MTLKETIKEGIWQAIQSILPREIANAPYNNMKYGKIVAVLENDKYNININGNNVTIPAISGDSYFINDSVIVCVPNNNIQKQFIVGKVRY